MYDICSPRITYVPLGKIAVCQGLRGNASFIRGGTIDYTCPGPKRMIKQHHSLSYPFCLGSDNKLNLSIEILPYSAVMSSGPSASSNPADGSSKRGPRYVDLGLDAPEPWSKWSNDPSKMKLDTYFCLNNPSKSQNTGRKEVA